MPESAVADAPAVVDPEPKDKRTNEWKAWKARQDAGATATVDIAPTVAIPKAGRAVRVMPPDEFIPMFLTNDAAGIRALNNQPNPVSSIADACWLSYRAYLLLISPSFSADYKASNSDAATRFLPDPMRLWDAYDVARGA